MTSTQTLAAELYGLESSRPMTGEQLQRWNELAGELFGVAGKRRSPRVRAAAQVLVGVETVDVIDASWQGMLVQGLAAKGDLAITAIRARETDDWHPVELACQVSRVDESGAVLELTETDVQKRHDFLMHAYYPMYLSHLRELAQI